MIPPFCLAQLVKISQGSQAAKQKPLTSQKQLVPLVISKTPPWLPCLTKEQNSTKPKLRRSLCADHKSSMQNNIRFCIPYFFKSVFVQFEKIQWKAPARVLGCSGSKGHSTKPQPGQHPTSLSFLGPASRGFHLSLGRNTVQAFKTTRRPREKF